METKEELLVLKSAIKHLIENIFYIDRRGYINGLCGLASYCLPSREYLIFKNYVREYGESIGINHYMYIWERGAKEPRIEWLEKELEKVNQKLKEYEDKRKPIF